MSDRDFRTWLEAVDQYTWQLAGLSAYDLPDWDFRTAFDDGVSVRDAALAALADAGWCR